MTIGLETKIFHTKFHTFYHYFEFKFKFELNSFIFVSEQSIETIRFDSAFGCNRLHTKTVNQYFPFYIRGVRKSNIKQIAS